jgi:hypothetical protein
MANIKQSETVIIKRSQINFAPYNPRKKDKKVVEALKANFKKVGFLGGIQWNATTGNLIGGHKRTEALDLVFGYDGSEAKDYEIKVEKIELDEKTEKEQNIFLNNKNVQGSTDYELMAELVKDIDIEEAGLTEIDMDLIETLVPDFTFSKNESIKEDISNLNKSASEKKEDIQKLKKDIKSNIGEKHMASYFCITFKSYDDKAEYLESIGINGDIIYITGEKFINRLNDN